MKKDFNKLAIISASVLSIFLACGWMLGTGNAFLMDDYSTITKGMFSLPSTLFTVFPTQRYNDRPVGSIFVGLLQKMFADNYQGYHLIFVLVHIVNILLVYRIAYMILRKEYANTARYGAAISAVIFGAYPQSIMAVQWVSAVFDLLAALFTLLTLYFSLKKNSDIEYKAFYSICTVACYIVALRCKEMPLLLPVALYLYEMVLENKKKVPTKATGFMLCWMIIYLWRLFSYPAVEDSTYHQAYGMGLVANLAKYINLYFDLSTNTMNFIGYRLAAVPGVILLLIAIGVGIYKIRKKQFSILVNFITVGLLLAPVLTMDNMQHKLYLYIPSAFLGIIAGQITCIILMRYKVNMSVFSVIAILLIGLCNYMPGPIQFRNWWCTMTQQDLLQLEQVEGAIGTLPQNCDIYVRRADQEYNVIWPYGPGNSIRFLYRRNDINCNIVDEFPDMPTAPYIFLDYENKQFFLDKRDDNYDLKIQQVSCNRIDDKLQIGVVCEKNYPGSQIVINGEAFPTVEGESFVSTEISDNEFNNNQALYITVRVDNLGIESAPYILNIDS